MRIDSITDIGVKREDNQDNYWSARLMVEDEEVGIICLCDGMGGLSKGGLASKIAISSIRDYCLSSIDNLGIVNTIKTANRKILELSNEDGTKMGTTCTLLLCKNGRYTISHVGDSRCYLIKSNSDIAIPLTKDHSAIVKYGIKKDKNPELYRKYKNSLTRCLRCYLIKSNSDIAIPLTKDHSAIVKYGIKKDKNPELYRKYKNSLTRCLGVKSDVIVDTYEGDYEEGDIFFCCSDGFWHYLEDYSINREMLGNLQNLVKSCISNGETDNITVGVLYV